MRLNHRLYYFLKPVLPWRVRMTARRIVARYERAQSTAVWPIKPTAAQQPADWPGWPDGKQFACVLTHDVEGPEGLAQVRQLAELEMELGFRSSFNFIPSGDYAVPAELRHWLTSHGFEVGVHDWQHDGRLFQSSRDFARKAVRINQHLHEWGAAGFRAGFMLRNLDWQHQLEIEYDASTFDTDPFELQSDGTDTIFPFWIRSPGSSPHSPTPSSLGSDRRPRGYVELPYTLPQDSTLFLVLGEKTPEIWLKKTDWVASHGGMVLVNVHPDYINFSTGEDPGRKYPAAHYADLLRHLRQNHREKFWQPLPREMAAWFKTAKNLHRVETSPYRKSVAERHPGLSGMRAAVLLYSEYPADPRPRRAAEAMIEAGMEVDLLCVAGSGSEPETEIVGGVHVTRLPIKRSRDSKLGYLWKYACFIASSFWFLTKNGLQRKYDVVHVHNMPDVLVFSTLLAKLAGAKVILDLHDPMPEVMMTIYSLEERRLAVRLLKLTEKWSIGLANTVITVNEACRRIFSTRSCSQEKVNVIMNSPDEGLFAFHDSPGRDPAAVGPAKPFVIMYHGSIVERHGLDVAVDALQRFRATTPHAELRIYGSETPFLRQVLASISDPALKQAVHYLGKKNLNQIVAAIRECDVGIIPNRRSIFTELNTPTRIFEYLSQGKPVIAPRAAGILDYFGAADLVYFELGSVDDLADKLAYVHAHPDAVRETIVRGQAVYRTHLWSNEKHRFIDVVARTLGLTAERREEVETNRLVPAEVGK